MNIEAIKKDFPFYSSEERKDYVYLDSGATSLKPASVIEAMDEYYREYSTNIHRGAYALSEKATSSYESARQKVASFIGASEERCCIFTQGTTAGLNALAYTLGESYLEEGDALIVPAIEHHANLIPWQQLAFRKKLKLLWLELGDDYQLNFEQYQRYLKEKPKLVCLSWVSNVLGTVHPVAHLAAQAKEAGAIVVLDAAQGVPHLPTQVHELGVDFMVFSGHKMLGPTGIGVLWGERSLLESLEPFMFGGSMILQVKREGCRWAQLPQKWEAGTPPIAEAIGLGAAVDYLSELDMYSVREHEQRLLAYAYEKLQSLEGFSIIGPSDPSKASGLVSFTFRNLHPHDIATLVDRHQIAVRAGHHCCQPLMRDLELPGTTRASFYIYNTEEDVDRLYDALVYAGKVFSHASF